MLENHFLPGDLETSIKAFVEHYNHQSYYESLNKVTYTGPDKAILE